MQLSIILPVYNGEQYIQKNLLELEEFLAARIEIFEIVVINDGSTDRTGAILSSLQSSRVRPVSLPMNKGKFAALKVGMRKAVGACKIFTDADLPFELESVIRIKEILSDTSIHIVVGDRSLPESIYHVKLTLLRSVTTHLFSLFVRLFVSDKLSDTQCGLKGFQSDIADELFSILKADGFSGDVELLYLATQYNLTIKKIPVHFKLQTPSTVNIISHGWESFINLIGLPGRWRKGMYDCEKLGRLTLSRHDF